MILDPYHYVRNRVLLAIACLVAAIVAAVLLTPDGNPDTRVVTGTVVEVNVGQGESLRSGSTVTLVTARVALDSGEEVRVLVGGPPLETGQRVPLVESRHPDGTVRYRLRAAED